MSIKEKDVIYGMRVTWWYSHCIGRSRHDIGKYGILQKLIRHTSRYRGSQLAIVLFNGNKTPSRVPLNELYERGAG